MASSRLIQAALLVAVIIAVVVGALQVQKKRQEADQAVDDINEQLDALDPVTRAAVVARLSSQEAKKVRDQP